MHAWHCCPSEHAASMPSIELTTLGACVHIIIVGVELSVGIVMGWCDTAV